MKLSDLSIHSFIQEYRIKNEVGADIDFNDHLFLFDIYKDFSPKLCVMKAAQVGATTMEIIKVLWAVKNTGLDAIYTLPTDDDVTKMVSSKVNRIIAHNPIFQHWTKDKDSIEQKQVADHFIHFKGTWTQKAAIMVSADWLLFDEIDSSKPDVVEMYASRLQHSKYKWQHFFSHPNASAISKIWEKSDQKHWFIQCATCEERQYMSWPESVDMEHAEFICKYCKHILTRQERRKGVWVQKYKDREFSGYWVPLLIAPWVSAKEIIDYFHHKSEEYFMTRVLGLPYIGGGNKLTYDLLMQNLTTENLYPNTEDRVVIGLDTGTQLYYVIGSERGLFYYGIAKDYDEIDNLMRRWPRAIVICDQGGDLIGSRKLRERWTGRVYLCTFVANETTDNPVWGKGDEQGTVKAGRNKWIQIVVDEFSDKRIPLMGDSNAWHEYWLHWSNLTRIKEMDDKTGLVKRKIWVKNGQSDFSFAHVYMRIGLSRFSSKGSIVSATNQVTHPSIDTPFIPEQEYDWRR